MKRNSPDMLTEQPDPDVARRRDRESKIRRQSDLYGLRWCADHFHLMPEVISSDHSTSTIRVYNRTEHVMSMVPVRSVLDAIPENVATLRPTAFGQIPLLPTMHVSACIVYLLTAVKLSVKS